MALMASGVEEKLAKQLRAALARAEIGETLDSFEEFIKALTALDWLLPGILGEVHSHWKGRSFDGFLEHRSTKIGPASAEVFGMISLISDMTMVPIHVRLRVSQTVDEIEWLECRVGEVGGDSGGMIRHPISKAYRKRKSSSPRSVDAIDWAYAVTYGEPDSDEP